MRDKAHPALILGLVALLLLLLGYAFSLAVRAGLADVDAEPAKNLLQAGRDSGDVLSQEEWRAIHDGLRQALALAPGDPENISELARLYRVQLEIEDLDAEQITLIGNAAAAWYQSALMRRPTWPWDWIDLARVKYEQYQDAGAVYQDALVRAVEFGPREALVQDQAAWLGMNTWSTLRPSAALAVLTAADRALEADPEALDWMLEDAERWRLPCSGIGERFKHFRRRCERLGLT